MAQAVGFSIALSHYASSCAGILLLAGLSAQSHETQAQGPSGIHSSWRWQALALAPQYESISAVPTKQLGFADEASWGRSSDLSPEIQSVVLACHPEGMA